MISAHARKSPCVYGLMRGTWPGPFLITPTSYDSKTKPLVWETAGCVVYTAHFRPCAPGGPSCALKVLVVARGDALIDFGEMGFQRHCQVHG